MSEWTHTYREPYAHRTEWLRLIEEAPPHDGDTYWFLSRRGVNRAFKLSNPYLKKVKVKK